MSNLRQLPRVDDERGSMTYLEAGIHIPHDMSGMELILLDAPGSRSFLERASGVICLSGIVEIQHRHDAKIMLDRPDVEAAVQESSEITSRIGPAVCLVFQSRP